MAQPTKLSAKVRSEAPQAVRRRKAVPAILYGHGLASQEVEVDAQQFEKVFRQTGATSLVTLMVGDTEHAVIIRDVQYHALKGSVQHADFYQVRMDEVIKAEIPIVVIGEAPAVKDLGGVLVRNIDELSVEALPKDLPHNIEVNISSLTEFEKVIRVKDLIVPSGVTVLADPEVVVTLVQAPRTEEELEALTEEVKEDVQSVEGMKTKSEQEKEAEAADSGAAPEAKADEKKPEAKK